MTFSRTQQWLAAGFGVVLVTLIGTAMIARQAIVHRVHLAWGEENNEFIHWNGLLVAIAEAEIFQQAYLDSNEEEALELYYEQLEIIEDYLGEAFEAFEDFEEDSVYKETLQTLSTVIEDRIQLLEAEIDQYTTGQLNLSARLELAQQSQEAQLDLQVALQNLFAEDSFEQQWKIADTSVSANNALWLTSVAVGLGMITLIVLYGWLRQFLIQQEKKTADLQRENQSISQKLRAKATDLKSTKATLRTESNRRQELESTYKEIEQAKELTDLKLNFFSLASHELRTPLSAILVSAQLLDNPHVEWSEAKRSRNLRRIQSSAKTMTQLLADILLLTRAEAGKLEFNPRMIELEDFCQKLVNEVKFNTQSQHHISVLKQGECEYAYLDEKPLRSLLMSLLTNAIKYSPYESEIQFTIWGSDGRTRFQVSDQGIGIPLADQQHLFESFHRGQNVKDVSGVGLGLAVVKKCLDLHGGTIEVESQVGVGTTFIIDIPWEHSVHKAHLS